ncbi:MAG: SDR family oxidoreductase [Planctomycetota bacterium]|nr:SDR family oxidoreductase [Planctomycetota bacterium]
MSKWAIVTGASSGIGAAFSPLLAAKGYNLILVARRRERLQALQEQLVKDYKIEARVHVADLTDPEAPKNLLDSIEHPIDVLVNNAGFGKAGEASAIPVEDQLKMIDLNIRALTALTLTFLPKMRERGSGCILNVGSVVGFVSVPYMSVYAATKAYVLSFSEALDHETRPHGVRVQVLCPGSTQSEFYDVAQSGDKKIDRPDSVMMTSEQVAKIGVNMIGGGSSTKVAGFMNRLVSFIPRLLPRRLMTFISGRFTPAAPSK